MFFNEKEILKIRLEELYDSVDHFILVESHESFMGKPKPLYFKENEDDFEKYLDKIIHIVVERHPELGVWEREHYQRNCILRGLTNCSLKDIIIMSDLDEIPRRELFPEIINQLHSKKLKRVGHLRGIALEQTLYYYQLNRVCLQYPGKGWGGDTWYGTIFTTYADLFKTTPQSFRDHRCVLPNIKNAGWHFSYMGGPNMIREKLTSFSHGVDKCDESDWRTADIEQHIRNHPAVPLDESFPQYVRDNIDYFTDIGYIAPYP